jgi:hypothetical protein
LRHQSSITSLSWIPREAIEGTLRVAFDAGLAQYDAPPPDVLTDIEQLRASDGFRFANRLEAWLEVDDSGHISDWGYAGGGLMGATTLRLGSLARTFEAIRLPDLRRAPEREADFVRFVQTTGGHTGVPAPRRVRRPPFVQWQAPLVWTTLSLTIHADGSATGTLEGASQFPRHWVYDERGELAEKSGLADFEDWYRESFGEYTPWGDRDSPALVMAVETAVERQLSEQVMAEGQEATFRKLKEGTTLVREGETGSAIYLVLDGVLAVEREGKRLAEYGPGAMLGERAHLEGGKRSSTLVAVTNCRVASVEADQLDRAALDELAKGHRREGPDD